MPPKEAAEAKVQTDFVAAGALSDAELEAMKLRAKRVRDRVAMNNSFSVVARSISKTAKTPVPAQR